jgi:hypothetical protein
MSDAAALTKAFTGARSILVVAADYFPGRPRARKPCDRAGRSGVRPALRRVLEQLRRAGSGRYRASRGLLSSEQKLNAIGGLNVLHLRAAYFMENNLAAIGMIHRMGLVGNALLQTRSN